MLASRRFPLAAVGGVMPTRRDHAAHCAHMRAVRKKKRAWLVDRQTQYAAQGRAVGWSQKQTLEELNAFFLFWVEGYEPISLRTLQRLLSRAVQLAGRAASRRGLPPLAGRAASRRGAYLLDGPTISMKPLAWFRPSGWRVILERRRNTLPPGWRVILDGDLLGFVHPAGDLLGDEISRTTLSTKNRHS
jgi:hypothetical protein